jgi:hypothetical protein
VHERNRECGSERRRDCRGPFVVRSAAENVDRYRQQADPDRTVADDVVACLDEERIVRQRKVLKPR